MSPQSRGTKIISLAFNSSNPNQRICLSCQRHVFRRSYAVAAAVQTPLDASAINQRPQDEPQTLTPPVPNFVVKAGIVLSRPPLITPDLHPFEEAYLLYQRRLNERLVLPFSQYFYYKRGTPAFAHWRNKRRERGGAAARDVGKYNAYTDEAWNDEVLVGDKTADPQNTVEKLIEEEGRASDVLGEIGNSKLAGLRRTTEADANNDQRSLERQLDRTLYLLVRSKGDNASKENLLWSFPSGQLEGKEGLKEAAQRILDQSCGVNMNTWFVGNHPVGYYTSGFARNHEPSDQGSEESETSANGEPQKTFFMKARIMAGQANTKNTSENLEDFRWLAKEEIPKLVHPNYWSKIRNMIVD